MQTSSPDDILKALKTLKITRLHTFRRNEVATLERKMWPLCKKRGGHFWNNPQATAISHLSKMFNYYHQRENLIIIYYHLCDKAAFDKRWIDYDTKIISKCAFPNGYELNAAFQDLSADFKSKSSAIRVGKTGHASGSVIYHIFLQISYNV